MSMMFGSLSSFLSDSPYLNISLMSIMDMLGGAFLAISRASSSQARSSRRCFPVKTPLGRDSKLFFAVDLYTSGFTDAEGTC